MSVEELIIGLYIRVDTLIHNIPKHDQAKLYPSEVVTLALLFALKGDTERAFYRWIHKNYRGLFPGLPHRTRLFRLFATHQDWSEYFLAQPTILGVCDTYGIELIHPWREDRSAWQIGRKGLSNHRWIVGTKLAYLVNSQGLIVAWESGDAGMADNAFQSLISDFEDKMVVFTDIAFHSKDGHPSNQKACKRGTWSGRMVVETVLSMLTRVCNIKKMSQRCWDGVNARLAYTMVLFNILVTWDGLVVDEDGTIRLSIADFSL